MECYKKCVEIKRRCPYVNNTGSCADCGTACRSNFLITSRTNCRCNTSPVSQQSNTADRTKGRSEQTSPSSPGKQQPEQQHQHLVEGEENQTWWQWLLSLIGLGGIKEQTKDQAANDKNRKYKAETQKPDEVISPQAILAEAREICKEIKKHKPEPYQPNVEQATSPVASPKKEEKGSETYTAVSPEEKKRKRRGKSPPRSGNRDKYLGRPLDTSPKQRSPRASASAGRKSGTSPIHKESPPRADKSHFAGEPSPASRDKASALSETKRPPTSPIYSSEKYLKPYTSELCPVNLSCSECCECSSKSLQTCQPKVSCGNKKSKKRAKKERSPSRSCTNMPCGSCSCLVCGARSYPPLCCQKSKCSYGTSLSSKLGKQSTCRSPCPPSSPCFCLEETTRDMRRRRRSVSPCDRSSPCLRTIRRRSVSCPSSPAPSCSPCPPYCPLPCCKPCKCPASCPPPTCCPFSCSCKSCKPCKPSHLPPPLCKTCSHLSSSLSQTPKSCCPPISPCCIPPGCRVGPGCKCPITCTKPCCVPTCFPRPKQPCQAPSPSAYNRFQPFRSFGMSTYTRSRDNDALCRTLMAKYNVSAPDPIPFCPKPRVSICSSCDYTPKASPKHYPMPLKISGCPACPSPGCNNNKLTSSSFCDTMQNYTYSKKSPFPYQQPINDPITFNTLPSQSQPRIEFRIPKRTPVECIKQTGPRSPCKEFMSTFNFPKEFNKDRMVKDIIIKTEEASVSEDKTTESPPKSGNKSSKRSLSKRPREVSKEKKQTSAEAQKNISGNKTTSKSASDLTPISSLLSWRASSQKDMSLKQRIRSKGTEKCKKQRKRKSTLLPEARENHSDDKSCSPILNSFSSLKHSTSAVEEDILNIEASSTISNRFSPVLKSSDLMTEKSNYSSHLYSTSPKNLSPILKYSTAMAEDSCYEEIHFQPNTKSFYSSFLNVSASTRSEKQDKALNSPLRLGRRLLTTLDKSPSIILGSSSKTSTRSPLFKRSFVFNKETVSDHHPTENEFNKMQLSSSGSIHQDMEAKDPWKKGESLTISNKGSCLAIPEHSCHEFTDHSINKQKTTKVEEGDEEVHVSLKQDIIEKSQNFTIKPTEIESISRLVSKYDSVEVSAVGVMAQSNCNVFDYISVESSPAITLSSREDHVLSFIEELSVEEDITLEEADALPYSEEKQDTVTALENLITLNTEAAVVKMNNVGSAVDFVAGDNGSPGKKIDLIATSYDKDATVKLETSIGDHYHIPLFNIRLELFPQKVDLRKLSDFFFAGESSVDPAEFGVIGESAVDPTKEKLSCRASEHECFLFSEMNHSNNNQDEGRESSDVPAAVADLSHNEPAVQDTTSTSTPEVDIQDREEKLPPQAAAGDTISTDVKPKSALEELLSSSGVTWSKVTEPTDAELKLIRLGKTALNMRNRPVLPTTASFSGQGMPNDSDLSPANAQPKSDSKPYEKLLKPGEIERSELSTDIEELLRDSPMGQMKEYGTPV